MNLTKILLVDDKPENILALRKLLESSDIEILSAESGEEALSHLLDHDFALALLDVQMPGMSGFELAELMRGAERSRNIPIIFVTAASLGQDTVFAGYEHGAVDFLFKPLSPHIVRSKVRVFIELDRQRRDLRRLKDEAEAASRAKSQFLANMSHEIRTPLGAMLGFAELLNHSSLPDPERDNCLETIVRNGRLLARLIDDILDFSKIEAGRIEVERIPVSIDDLLSDLESMLTLKAQEKGIQLVFHRVGEKLPAFIESDPTRLRQILINVIGNAIKFTENGSVEITVEMRGDSSLQRLAFTIKDTGCGLSVDEAKRLFQPFTQADSSTTRRFGGTGLGLTIARQLARILGGDVTLLESELERGSCFLVEIAARPARVASTNPIAKVPASTLKDFFRTRILNGVRVLVVDDSRDIVSLMHRILTLAGADVLSASDGIGALRILEEHEFDVILMDIQMPDMDGCETVMRLRSQGYRRPIIALTAHTVKDELDRCIAAGFSAHLSKLVDHEELIQTLLYFAKI